MAARAAYFLIFREDGSNKFWFGRLDGASWTAEWGRRGSKGQSKTYTFATPEKARADFEAKVREKVGKGYEIAPEGARVAEAVGKPSWRFKLGKEGEDQFGGMPPGVDEEAWPHCKDCEHPQQFILLLNAHEQRLPLKKHAGLALFMCDGEVSRGSCDTFDPYSGANAVLLLSREALTRPPLKRHPPGEMATSKVLSRRGFLYREVLDPEPTDEENSRAMHDKVGGYPGWLQGVETPKCRKCRKRMSFVAQLEDQAGELNFGDSGEGYLFVCPEEHEGRFLWQCC
jgi:predicted DNA-binding WGR domain protein